MHGSHDWHSMAAEGAEYACRACGTCSCHHPDVATAECTRSLLARPCREYGCPKTPEPGRAFCTEHLAARQERMLNAQQTPRDAGSGSVAESAPLEHRAPSAAREFVDDEAIAWDDGDATAIAVWHEPSSSWTVTGSDDIYGTVAELIEHFPSASGWRRIGVFDMDSASRGAGT